MPRYKITIEYKGTNLAGWQRQNNALTIQQILEEAFYNFTRQRVNVHGAGRTDAGVHAYGQVAHIDLNREYSAEEIIGAVNFYSRPHKVGLISCIQVAEDFHARYNAVARHYLYRILNRQSPAIIDADNVYWVKQPLNIESMKLGAKYLVGSHDFTSFRASCCQAKSPIKTLTNINIEKIEDEVKLWVSAPSFLHHMVRNIVGTLVQVGIGKLTPQDVKKILELRKREAAGATAPSSGLYFYRVDY